MPRDLMTAKEWKKRTFVLTKRRSAKLRDLDEQIAGYEKYGGGAARWYVEQKLDAWKQTKGPGGAWQKDARNKDFAISELTTQLSGVDSDAYREDVPGFMNPALVHARLGVLYLHGNTRVNSNLFNVILSGGLEVAGSALSFAGSAAGGNNARLEAVGTNMKTVMIPGQQLLEATEEAGHTAKTPQEASLLAKIVAWLTDFAKKILRQLAERFGDVKLTLSALKNLINVLAGTFLKQAAPFIGAGMDVFKGLVNTCDAVATRLQTWWSGRGVEILAGHPSIIVDSITRAMNMSIWEGLYQTLKGAAKVGLAIFSAQAAVAGAVATLIVDLIIAICETIIKVVWRLVEMAKMRTFFAEAAEHYGSSKRPRSGLHTQPVAFNRWFKKHALKLPPLSVLTLNSGICGDKMHFLKMYKDDTTVVTQAEFNKGVSHIDGLKSYGSGYLKSCGYIFHSDDKYVNSVLDFTKKHDGGGGSSIWNGIVTLANA